MRVGDGDGSRDGVGAPKKALLRGTWGARPLAWDLRVRAYQAQGSSQKSGRTPGNGGLLSMLGRQLWLVQVAKGRGKGGARGLLGKVLFLLVAFCSWGREESCLS